MVRNKRIIFLASLLKDFNTVLDIGSDHGYVLEEAFKNGYIKKGIASDVRKMPLERSLKTLENYPTKGILSDGFLAIDDTFDAAVIAGMGAQLISDIMAFAPLHEATYILQANDKYELLRRNLNHMNFKIIDEYMVCDKFYYVIIIVRRGKEELSEEDFILGPILKTKDHAMPYYKKRLEVLIDIMKQADSKRKEELQAEYHILFQHLKK